MTIVYEISGIHKQDELLEADSARIGRRVTIAILEEGYRALLPHADDSEKALFTSVVKEISGEDGDDDIHFVTQNTTYTLRKVVE